MNNPSGLCKCGCGQRTTIAPYTSRKDGWIKGQPLQFVQGHQNRGKYNSRYNLGLCFSKHGNRWMIKCIDNTYVRFARAVMECMIGRVLAADEVVHHKNGDPTDDRPQNLVLCAHQAEHQSIAHYGYTRESMLEALRRYRRVTGNMPTTRKIKRLEGMPSSTTYNRRFGSFNNALKEAGLL